MLRDRQSARALGERDLPAGIEIDDGASRELEHGWFFGYRALGQPVAGASGVIVNKRTGKRFQLGSAFPPERDIELYDRGYQFDCYDLVILEVRDLDATLDALGKIGLSVVEPVYENGTVWRVPRPLSRKMLRDRLTSLPCVFGESKLYFHLEILEAARTAGIMQFEALEYRLSAP